MSAKPSADSVPQKRPDFDVPEEPAHRFKAHAALQGKSQRETVIAFMQRCTRRAPGEAAECRRERQHGLKVPAGPRRPALEPFGQEDGAES